MTSTYDISTVTTSATLSPQKAITLATQFITTTAAQDPALSVPELTDKATTFIFEALSAQFPAGSFPEAAIRAMAAETVAQAQHNIASAHASEQRIQSISPEELDNIHTLINNNALAIKNLLCLDATGEVFSPGVDHVANFVVALTAHALASYHPSGWIKYDKKAIIALAGLAKLSIAQQSVITKQAHDLFGFQMRVIGSNQPIPCYSLPWLVPPQAQSLAISNFDPVKIQDSIRVALKLFNGDM